jgi:tetratricopeptide (TPR) repeat protein
VAVVDASQIEAANTLLSSFVETNRDHYRFYEAQSWLGDVALAADDISAADEAYNSLANSPWVDFQMSGKIGLARVLLSRNDLRGARQGFDEVVNTPVTDNASRERRLEAMIGQARVMQLEEDHEPAINTLAQVIDESTADDTKVQAEAYLRQGSSYQAMGVDPKEAIMAYLHVDVIPALAKESDFHAEALYHLSQLWAQIGDTARATDASERLRALYPNSEWASR